MKNIICLAIAALFLSSCTFYLPGYDFKLFKNTPANELADAVEDEDLEEIEEIVKDKVVNIDYQEPKFGNTVLMLAVANNKNKAARKLLELGANPNIKSTKSDNAALIIASFRFADDSCNTEIVKDLIRFGADLNIKQNRSSTPGDTINFTPLMEAASTGKCLEIVKILVESGADINHSTHDNDGSSAVTLAVVSDHLEIARYLLIEKNAMIPRYIYRVKENTPEERLVTITDILNNDDRAMILKSNRGPYRDKLKQEILDYLESQGVR